MFFLATTRKHQSLPIDLFSACSTVPLDIGYK